MSNNKWDDNELQFARLIHEIDATQNIDWDELAEQMDLYESEVREIVQRANEMFTGVKQDD
jgi:DNA-binding transcriptional regulator LsrR (DeoR family)